MSDIEEFLKLELEESKQYLADAESDTLDYEQGWHDCLEYYCNILLGEYIITKK